MKTIQMRSPGSLIALTLLCAGMLVIVSPAQVTGEKQRDQNEVVGQLRAKVQELETRIAELQKQVDDLKSAPKVVAVPGTPNRRMRVPKGSQRFAFNGLTYYMVPLDKAGAKPHKR
jgi:hypothetical protein